MSNNQNHNRANKTDLTHCLYVGDHITCLCQAICLIAKQGQATKQ